MTEEAATFQVFSHSVKISDTAKGIRIDVHVWANDGRTAIGEAFRTYLDARETAVAHKIPVAPVEVVVK